MKKWSSVLLIAMCTLGLATGGNVTHAAEKAENGGFPFNASAKLPENQVNKKVTYFDLQVQPNQEEELHVAVTNTTDKNITLEPSIHSGKTNGIGVIEYDHQSDKTKDAAKIESEATIDQKEIHLTPNQTIDLPIKIKMPTNQLQGIQVGALRLIQKNDEKTKGNIQNNFAREIGLVLQSSDPGILPSQLKMTKAKPSQVNYRNAVIESIQNNQPKLIDLKDVHATVTKAGDSKILYQQKQEDVSLAPQSTMDYEVSLNGKEFKPGNYTANFSAKEGNRTWKLKKNFTIKAEKSKKLNASDVVLKNKPSFFQQYKVFIVIGLVLLAVIVSLLIYLKRLKEKLRMN